MSATAPSIFFIFVPPGRAASRPSSLLEADGSGVSDIGGEDIGGEDMSRTGDAVSERGRGSESSEEAVRALDWKVVNAAGAGTRTVPHDPKCGDSPGERCGGQRDATDSSVLEEEEDQDEDSMSWTGDSVSESANEETVQALDELGDASSAGGRTVQVALDVDGSGIGEEGAIMGGASFQPLAQEFGGGQSALQQDSMLVHKTGMTSLTLGIKTLDSRRGGVEGIT